MMAVILPHHPSMFRPYKRQRRTATSVLAGNFDLRPARDVLTSLLNGVEVYKVVERDEETRRAKKREKKERDRERKRAKAAAKKASVEPGSNATITTAISASKSGTPAAQASTSGASAFWRARPAIHIATMQRSVSVTPPPMPSSPASTPGPSSSSSTSRTSSKRPRTPDDDEDLSHEHDVASSSPQQQQPRRKRVAVRKGWKGWVEGSPPPSDKLINLDAVPLIAERRTRSGKNFDAIGTGKDDWV